MPATSPASKAEPGIDAVVLRPAGNIDADSVPRFALIETRAPDVRALVLSPLILAALCSFAVAAGRLARVSPPPIVDQDVTMLVEPPAPLTLPAILHDSRSDSTVASAPVKPVTAEARPADPPEPPRTHRASKSATQPVLVAQAVSPAPVRNPTPIPVPQAVAPAASAALPVSAEPAKPAVVQATAAPANDSAQQDSKLATNRAAPLAQAAGEMAKPVPQSLGGLPLTELIDDQDGLAAGLAALPWSQRLNLPRVSIRVNAAWVEALPKTQERLYFSITTPRPDREVLAYLAATRDFELERPEHPLWQVHEGERVPALAELRAAAARLLGVPPELVGLYTWHPRVFEDALQMFVLERMQQLRVHLGPRDVVTVRLAATAAGTVMNLEPLRADALP